ncbi:MAG TPA: ABC transporter ATP-binding protein [Actinomycetota bacterium]|nr:ABC transporter ATP-binding protein [Actinomycetota bacterium]
MQSQVASARATGVAVRFEGVTKRFSSANGSYTAVDDVTFDVPQGSFTTVVGPSGCGKSTLLNMTAGLTPCSAGSIEVFSEPLSGINRRAAYIFQQDALLPWKTVAGNVRLGLSLRGVDADEVRERSDEWLRRVGLSEFADCYPFQLSGGMRKRAAIAQSWIVDPDIMLMDEPFGALDVQTRRLMQAELLRVWSAARKTVVFVTHDLEEAIALADEVVVMSAGPASTVVGRYPVRLSRPRDLLDIRTDPGFVELYGSIWATLRDEVLRSYASGGTD